MRNITEIEKEISRLKEEYNTVQGAATEVYTRIVGYYRSVKNWNKGKREEFGIRRTFNSYNDKSAEIAGRELLNTAEGNEKPVSWKLFYKNRCPNCPPVKAAAAALPLKGEMVNVDDKAGLDEALNFGILATPTVIFFDAAGNESSRAYTQAEIERLFPEIVNAAEAVSA